MSSLIECPPSVFRVTLLEGLVRLQISELLSGVFLSFGMTSETSGHIETISIAVPIIGFELLKLCLRLIRMIFCQSVENGVAFCTNMKNVFYSKKGISYQEEFGEGCVVVSLATLFSRYSSCIRSLPVVLNLVMQLQLSSKAFCYNTGFLDSDCLSFMVIDFLLL